MRYLALQLFLVTAMAAGVANAAETLDVKVSGIGKDKLIEPQYAHCIADSAKHSVPDGKDENPEVSWSKGPKGTKSYAVIVVDNEVPTDFSNASKEGQTISTSMPRQNF